jgi:hypothetical protein
VRYFDIPERFRATMQSAIDVITDCVEFQWPSAMGDHSVYQSPSPLFETNKIQ